MSPPLLLLLVEGLGVIVNVACIEVGVVGLLGRADAALESSSEGNGEDDEGKGEGEGEREGEGEGGSIVKLVGGAGGSTTGT